MIPNKPGLTVYLITQIDFVGRINDKRMVKVRLKDASNKNSIETSHYSVADREALMGFPVGYVERFGESLRCVHR